MDRVRREFPVIRKKIMSNGTYKVIATVVTVVLWVSFVGRRETLSRDIDIQYLISPKQMIANSVATQVRVKIEGPRISLTRYSQKESVFKIDLVNKELGWNRIQLTADGLDLPVGVRFVSVTPNVIRANIQDIQGSQ
ncbi:MAG: hypothetical protein KDD61_10085 [Bdellovibrionales bacterium]|nr:hypothetical protein [Bdellovibrionales bacterium]